MTREQVEYLSWIVGIASGLAAIAVILFPVIRNAWKRKQKRHASIPEVDPGVLQTKIPQEHKPDIILLVAVTRVEVQSILEVFAPHKKRSRLWIGGKTYYSLGNYGGAPLLLVQSEMGSATPGGSLLTIHAAIADLNPQAVIMCGLAFGLCPDKQQLGDILISKQLEYYEPQKINIDHKEMPRGDRTMASERLLDRFESGDNDWKGPGRTYFGLVLTGEKLVNEPSFRQRLLESRPEALGGEMEGAGLYAAARATKVDWILVKAICDWADGTKNNDAQPKAARNAALFVKHVLQKGGWEQASINKPVYIEIEEPTPSNGELLENSNIENVQPLDPRDEGYLEVIIEGLIKNNENKDDWLGNLEKREPDNDGLLHNGLRNKLRQILSDPNVDVIKRISAGNVLAQLGDPRFLSNAWYLPDEDQFGFVEVPIGPFSLGEGSETGRKRPPQSPQHEISLPDFYLNRYPVTVMQYKAYLNSTEDPEADKLKGIANHPIRSVSWYDAMRYCKWINQQLCKWPDQYKAIPNLLKSGIWVITLPSEAEWEKAARGGSAGLVYPWGQTFDKNRANCTSESCLPTTSPVGCFPTGCSQNSLYDLIGNVEEWTRSNWGSNMIDPFYRYPYKPEDGREDTRADNNIHRVCRGGSFYSHAEDIRISVRKCAKPDERYDYIGFRLAITQRKQQ